MKMGTVILIVLIMSIFLFAKYREQVRGLPTASATTPTVAGTKKKRWFEWLCARHVWTVLLAGASLAIFYFGVHTSSWESPSLSEVTTGARNHWPAILALVGIGYILIAINSEALGAMANVLQWALATVAFMLFVGFPVWTWVTGPSSSNEANTLSMPPGGKSNRVAVPPGMRVVMNGKDIRYHCMYADGHEESFVEGGAPCSSGHMPFVYATNLRSNEPNAITYSYKK